MKRKKIIRYFLLFLLFVIAAAALYIYKEYNRTHTDTKKLKADFSMAATGLVKEFETNEAASNRKYWDKIISVKGTLKEVVKDEKGLYTLALGDTSLMSAVRCIMDSVHNKDAGSVTKGTVITVKGICSGFKADELLGSDVILVRSVVVSEK